MAIKIIIAILFFGFLIFTHELGHYLAARAFKVGINEFAIGMGPKLFSRVSKKTGIRYSLRLLPIGGYVSMVGEDEESDREDSLNKKSWWKRFIIVSAGAVMNMLCAIVAMFIMLSMSEGYATTTVNQYRFEESVIADSGILPGDKIVKVGNSKISTFYDLSYAILHDGVEPLDITVERDGQTLVFEDIVFETEFDTIQIGVMDFYTTYEKMSLGALITQAFGQSFSTVKIIYDSLLDLVTGRYGMEAVSGPVGTVEVITDAVDYGVSYFLYIFVFISMNLGIFNLLPIPALDGGRLVFILVEAVRRKPIKPEHEGYVHFAGLVLLLLFMVFVTVKDVIKIIG